MTNGATHDAAQHVLAPGALGRDALGNQERRGARVIGDDTHADVIGAHAARIGLLGQLGRRLHQVAQQIDAVVRGHPLHDAGQALEARARVDAGLGQRIEHRRPRLEPPLELHEHQVPNLDPAEAFRRLLLTERASVDLGPVEPINLRTRPAGPGVAHRPEIVRSSQAHDAIVPEARQLLPQVARLVVGRHAVLTLEVSEDHALRRQRQILRQELPSEGDGLLLEVIAEREIAEHLEERLVARRRSDLFQIVVLAADADALLTRGGARVRPLLLAREDVLELHHAGVVEHQRRIVRRNQRGTRHHGVPVPAEVLQKSATDLARRLAHGWGRAPSTSRPPGSAPPRPGHFGQQRGLGL